jgi:hypothetical protein
MNLTITTIISTTEIALKDKHEKGLRNMAKIEPILIVNNAKSVILSANPKS